jgi:hypothetical protein
MAVVYQVSVEWTEMIDGHIGKSRLLSEVWWVPVLSRPQQRKLGHHGRVSFLELCYGKTSSSSRAIFFYPR